MLVRDEQGNHLAKLTHRALQGSASLRPCSNHSVSLSSVTVLATWYKLLQMSLWLQSNTLRPQVLCHDHVSATDMQEP